MKFERRNRVINKMALMLLCMLVLELVLLGHQVESVKSLKKKILLKKLKKLLPLLALVKPKKKILLLPIPFPMFNKHGNQMRPNGQMMIRPNVANQGAYMVVDPMPIMPQPQQAPMMMLEPANMSSYDSMGPSMTMTISSADPGASMPSIELNTNMMTPVAAPAAPSQTARVPSTAQMSAPLIQQAPQQASKMLVRPVSAMQYAMQDPYQPENQRDCDRFNGIRYSGRLLGGNNGALPRPSLLSPAKFFRSERYQSGQSKSPIRQQQFSSNDQVAPIIIARTKQAAPLVTINHNWRPSAPAKIVSPPTQAPAQQQQQHPIQQQQIVEQNIEMEDLVSVGPPQLIPIYQTTNGRLHMTPPPQQSTTPASPGASTSSSSSSNLTANSGFDSETSALDGAELNAEVRFVGTQNQDRQTGMTSATSDSQANKQHLASGQLQSPRTKSQSNNSLGGY